GKLDFANFHWEASAGAVDEDGLYHPPTDPLSGVDQDATIRASVEGNPKVVGDVSVSPIYDCGATADFSGAPGTHGAQGDRGQPGRHGKDAEIDHRAVGGEDATDGGNGGEGEDGANATGVEVALAYLSSPKRGKLILARVGTTGGKRREYYL